MEGATAYQKQLLMTRSAATAKQRKPGKPRRQTINKQLRNLSNLAKDVRKEMMKKDDQFKFTIRTLKPLVNTRWLLQTM